MIAVIKQLIIAAAIAHGVSAGGMLGVADCESTFRPFVAGGGLYQLRSPGEADEFYRRGYTNVYDPAQQANFVAERFSEGVFSPWSCRYRYFREF